MLPLSKDQVKITYDQAMRLMGAGKLDQADKKFRMVLGAVPNNAPVHYQLGRIALMRNDPAGALQHLSDARRLQPSEPAIWQQMAEGLLSLGDATLTARFLSDAKSARLDPKLLIKLQKRLSRTKDSTAPSLGSAPPDEVQKTIQMLQSGKTREAERRARALRVKHPDVAIIALVLANSQAELGKLKEARENYDAAIRLDPNYADAHNTFGRFLVEQGQYDHGIREIRQALKLAPKLPLGYLNLGIGLIRSGQPEPALKALERAISLDDSLLEAHHLYGRQLMTMGRYTEAAESFKRTISRGHRDAIFHARLAQAQTRLNSPQDALASFAKAIHRDPKLAISFGLRALFLQELGRFDEAEQDFRTAIALQPDNGEIYRTFVASYKITPDDPLLARMERLFADPALGDGNRMHLGFALARAMEQIKAYDRIFEFLDPANALVRKTYPYDIKERRVDIDAIKTAFAGTDFATAKPAANASDFAPIFVTGMPRSGTTLVEQILASHSRVDGAGEVAVMTSELLRKMKTDGGVYRPFSEISGGDLRAGADLAETRLRAICPGAERVTDKAIQTYMVMGAVRLVFPRAHIVLVRRDPRDTLLSIYKNMFTEGMHRYAYNQRDLGLYYRMFVEMVEFWREKLPGGFHEIQYEDLIADPEAESRKLLAACDLEWEDQCLDFHKNTRKVSTLSVAQVRQPIYASSMQAWKRHENDIAEMIEALGDAV